MNEFNIGDCVEHRKFGMGEIVDVDKSKQMYCIQFVDTGFHRVKFSTKITYRENLDYKYINIEGRKEIRTRFIGGQDGIGECIPFSIEKYNKLSIKDYEWSSYFDKYYLKHRRFWVRLPHDRVISKRFGIVHHYGMSIDVELVFVHEDFCNEEILHYVRTKRNIPNRGVYFDEYSFVDAVTEIYGEGVNFYGDECSVLLEPEEN